MQLSLAQLKLDSTSGPSQPHSLRIGARLCLNEPCERNFHPTHHLELMGRFLQQVEVAQMLGRHKSWVNRRLALIGRLCDEAREALRLGLLTPTGARHLTRLPRGNQQAALQSASHAALTSRELSDMVDLLLASSTQEQTQFVLEKPRQAIAQSQDHHVHQWDSRLSAAGNRLAKRLSFLLDSLSKMNTYLRFEVVHRTHRGESKRRIAMQLGVSRWKVAEILRRHHQQRQAQSTSPESTAIESTAPDVAASDAKFPEPIPPSLGRAPAKRPSKLDAYEAKIRQLLERYPKITNVRLYEELQALGYRPWACQVRRPQTKGKVERPFYYIETNLLNARQFRSLDHLNESARWWLAEVADKRIHSTTKKTPLELHAEELPHLLPLPSLQFDTAQVEYRITRLRLVSKASRIARVARSKYRSI